MIILNVPQGVNILLQANATLKFIPQLTGQREVTVADEDVNAMLKDDARVPSRSDVTEALLITCLSLPTTIRMMNGVILRG